MDAAGERQRRSEAYLEGLRADLIRYGVAEHLVALMSPVQLIEAADRAARRLMSAAPGERPCLD